MSEWSGKYLFLFKLNNVPQEVLEISCNFSFSQWEGFAEPGETTTAACHGNEQT